MWDTILKKASSKKMIIAIVAMWLLSSADPGYIAAIAIIALACQWSLDMKLCKGADTEEEPPVPIKPDEVKPDVV